MVDAILQGAWVLYRFNKDEGDESLPLLIFRRHVVNEIFLKNLKEGRLSSSHIGIQNISSDVCYADTKNFKVHTRNQNTFKHIRWNAFA